MLTSLRYHYDASTQAIWTIPAVLFTTTVLACVTTPSQHSLLLHTITWSALCVTCTVRTGVRALLEHRSGRATAFGAGFLVATGQICERAAGAQNLWWVQALLPTILYAIYHVGIIIPDDDQSGVKERRIRFTGTLSVVGLLSLCALVASYKSTGSNTLIALGLSYLVLSSLTLLAIQRALREASARRDKNTIYTTNGLLKQPSRPSEHQDNVIAAVQDISVAAGTMCLVTALTWEPWRFDGLEQWGLLGSILGDSWIRGQSILSFIHAVVAIIVQFVSVVALVLAVHREQLVSASLVLLVAHTLSSVFLNFTFGRLWFLCLVAALLIFSHGHADSPPPPRRLRVIILVAIISIIAMLVQQSQTTLHNAADGLPKYSPDEPLTPVQLIDSKIHPIAQLAHNAQADWSSKVSRQSKTLEAAVSEYRRRYGMSPPPNFDKWFEFAKTRNVRLIDEYDTIYHSLLPFWAMSPATIRARAREALGYPENNLMALQIREGKAVHVERADDWQQRATVGLLEQFTQYLPDMDLAFNIHDEPRVVVPHAGLAGLVQAGIQAIAATSSKPENVFSRRPTDLNAGQRIEEVKTTSFNFFPHQHTWGPARISCPADTPVGSFKEESDNLTAYALGDLGFVYNQTAFSDICNSPSFETSHGFFERANAFNVVHDLFPIFSTSKMSSFQDILYPSPWYWYDKVPYRELMDMNWEFKENTMWWRGSTTGGFAKDGGWRRQHRQRLVGKINARDKANILSRGWTVAEVDRKEYRALVSVHFSDVTQCDKEDCAAQNEFFSIAPKTDQQEAWKYKYLLDMDGNAFSGRFYAFLKSHSLVFKMAVFREWHEDWIKPWVHYIPLSLRGEEILEAVRYIDAEPEGQALGSRMAETSSVWANSALRKEDFEVWFFRLLLEYGRLVDDNRESIGFDR